MDDRNLLATCIADEASGQPYEGKVAVGRVVLNRMAARYESDGTVAGTVLKRFQFSGFWFAMRAGHYRQVEFDAGGALTKAAELYAAFSTQPIWADCLRAVDDARAAASGAALSFKPGAQFARLTPATVLYLNPALCTAPWATPDKLDAVIFAHNFYHA